MSREKSYTLSRGAARQVRDAVRYAQGDAISPRRLARRQSYVQGDGGGVRVIEIMTATGTSWPREYTAKVFRRDATYGDAETAHNLAEDDYTNDDIINSYRAMQVGDHVLGWWNDTDSQWEFREFRLKDTEACP